MPITERTLRRLRRWRKEALIVKSAADNRDPKSKPADLILTRSATVELSERILRMTQELMDLQLLRKEQK